MDGPGAVAQFDYPTGVAVDCDGGIIVTDYGNHHVRKIAPDDTVSTLAGSGRAGLADGPGTDAQIFSPEGVSVDGEGNVILTDYGVGKKPVCKITPDGSVSTCFVGSCAFRGVVIDSEGCVVVSTEQHTVSKITGCCLARPRAFEQMRSLAFCMFSQGRFGQESIWSGFEHGLLVVQGTLIISR